MTNYIRTISGKPGSGEATTTFVSGAVSRDLGTARFFMKMQDENKSLDEVRAYIGIGPMMVPNVDWDEIARIADSFGSTS